MVKYTHEKIVSLISEHYPDRRIYILAPLVKNRKGHYKELFESLRKKGYSTSESTDRCSRSPTA